VAVRKSQEEKCWPICDGTSDRVCEEHPLPPFWPRVPRTAGLTVFFAVVLYMEAYLSRVGIAQHWVPVALMQL